jgi:superfamily I DNA/RNA helicase
MGWMVPLRKMDEAQQLALRQCADITAEQPKWIEGFAGSGKTVLLVHAIQSYLQKNPGSIVCIVVFTLALKDLISSGISPEFSDRIPVMTYPNFVKNGNKQYDLVVVDEVQDIPANILSAIRMRASKLLIGGDDAQSIYANGSRAEIIESILHPNRVKLPRSYRLTRKIINVIKNILPDSNIAHETSGRMQEVQITLAHADSVELELNWVWHQAKRETSISDPSVVVLPNHKSIQDFMRLIAKQEGRPAPEFPDNRWKKTDYSVANQHFLKVGAGICVQYLGNDFGSLVDSESRTIVYVMTYHSSKGLDFKTVFLPLLTSNTTFWRGSDDIDRRLFFVGATRSYCNLFMSYHGLAPHKYVQEMPQDELYKFEIDKIQKQDDEDFIF